MKGGGGSLKGSDGFEFPIDAETVVAEASHANTQHPVTYKEGDDNVIPPDGKGGGFYGTKSPPTEVFENGLEQRGSNWVLTQHIEGSQHAVDDPVAANARSDAEWNAAVEAGDEEAQERFQDFWHHRYGVSAFRGTTAQIAYPGNFGAVDFTRLFQTGFDEGFVYELCSLPYWDVTKHVRATNDDFDTRLLRVVLPERELAVPSQVPRSHIRRAAEVKWTSTQGTAQPW